MGNEIYCAAMPFLPVRSYFLPSSRSTHTSFLPFVRSVIFFFFVGSFLLLQDSMIVNTIDREYYRKINRMIMIGGLMCKCPDRRGEVREIGILPPPRKDAVIDRRL